MNTTEEFSKLNNPSHYQFESVDCYLCGEDDNEFLLVGEEDLTGKEGEFQYVTCKSCGLAYQNPRVAPEQIKDFYDSEYIAHRKKKDWGVLTPLYEKAMSKHDRDKDKLISKYVKLNSNSKVLDIGCAVGTFLLHLKDKYNCKISGVDFKDDLSFPRFNEIDFHCGLLYEQENIEENSYDLITMWHFLEHCYSPMESLKKARTLLNDGGKLIIEVPRLDSLSYKIFKEKWPGVQAPQHTVMFDKEHFVSMAEKAGFKVTKYLPYGAFPPYFYLFAGAYFKIFGKGMDLDKVLAPYFIGQLIMKPFLLFENKLNLAMQTIVCEKA
ncbi:MAG: class I SAM-dependent methyltransferase [Bacteriovoracaceae bacterium]|nr:class I SAM-dependent methyltransferase [Bacteriovoracaceae bacterium]